MIESKPPTPTKQASLEAAVTLGRGRQVRRIVKPAVCRDGKQTVPAWSEAGGRVTRAGQQGTPVGGRGSVPYLDFGDGDTDARICQNPSKRALKMLHFIVRKLRLSKIDSKRAFFFFNFGLRSSVMFFGSGLK